MLRAHVWRGIIPPAPKRRKWRNITIGRSLSMAANGADEIIEAWCAELHRQGKSALTIAAYRRALDHFRRWTQSVYGQDFDPARVTLSEPIVPVIAYNKVKVQQLGMALPKDDWTFDELAEWAKRGTTANTFGYYRGDSGAAPFGAAP